MLWELQNSGIVSARVGGGGPRARGCLTSGPATSPLGGALSMSSGSPAGGPIGRSASWTVTPHRLPVISGRIAAIGSTVCLMEQSRERQLEFHCASCAHKTHKASSCDTPVPATAFVVRESARGASEIDRQRPSTLQLAGDAASHSGKLNRPSLECTGNAPAHHHATRRPRSARRA